MKQCREGVVKVERACLRRVRQWRPADKYYSNVANAERNEWRLVVRMATHCGIITFYIFVAISRSGVRKVGPPDFVIDT